MEKIELTPKERKLLIRILNNQLDVISVYARFYESEVEMVNNLINKIK